MSLHGDFRYDQLKNTEEELQNQEAALQVEFLHELEDHDLVIVGYSGRDESLMRVLRQAYGKSNACRIFWCGYGPCTSDAVEQLLTQAMRAGNSAFYVNTDGFDDLLERLARRQLEGEALVAAKEILATTSASASKPMAFAAPPIPPTALVKSNAYPIQCPTHVLTLELSVPAAVDRRAWLDARLESCGGVGVVTGAGAFVLADSSSVATAFNSELRSSIVPLTLSTEDVTKDKRIQSLLRRALVRSLARRLGIETDGNRRVWERDSYRSYNHQGTFYRLHRALSFRLLALEGKPHIVLTPEVVPKSNGGKLTDGEVAKAIRNAVYGYQHNSVFDSDIKHWLPTIAGIEIDCPGGGVFSISRAPLFAGLTQGGRPQLPAELAKHARQSGLVVQDANLVFCARTGNAEVRDSNPLRGLVNNRPWDYQFTSSGLAPTIDVAVVCPSEYATGFKRFLAGMYDRAQPGDKERDYLHDFPGFAAAFGLPLAIPSPGAAEWLTVDDAVGGDTLSAAKQLATRICKALDVARSLRPGAVALIFVPRRWESMKVVKSDAEYFNLHDSVKSYAARLGQSTQFIREETTATTQLCRVRWWLSLALYAKGLRTPWRLDSLDEKTAFVGVGYSIDHDAMPGSHVLLGCSHIYSGRGEGLQFRLGRIENPIMRGRNPFMSEDDARRTGESIRQLFFEAKMHLPERVVVHKRTPFTDEEQRGLVHGLEGVPNVELIEVNHEESLRYLASKSKDGKLGIDTFPVPRGAVIVQDRNTALVWVHGAAPSAANPNFKYYQGKRRIPAPLLIRRYLGQADVAQVAAEILGLSKMNWNTFDYYSQLPATLHSASAIARVGTYLTGFSGVPYDYRLLI